MNNGECFETNGSTYEDGYYVKLLRDPFYLQLAAWENTRPPPKTDVLQKFVSTTDGWLLEIFPKLIFVHSYADVAFTVEELAKILSWNFLPVTASLCIRKFRYSTTLRCAVIALIWFVLLFMLIFFPSNMFISFLNNSTLKKIKYCLIFYCLFSVLLLTKCF